VVCACRRVALDADHPDLTPNLWVNPGEIEGNGIDDDGDGYVDDVWHRVDVAVDVACGAHDEDLRRPGSDAG
jgi:hypothetical protein